MKLSARFLILLLFIPAYGAAQTTLDTLSLKSIFYEPLLAGNRPDFVRFSPDDSNIYYQSNDSSMKEEEFFRVDLEGKHTTGTPSEFERSFRTSPDHRRLLYEKNGDIWLSNLKFKNDRQLLNTKADEYSARWSPGSKRIAYVSDGEVWVFNVDRAKLSQVTRKKKNQPAYNIITWADDSTLILSQLDTSGFKKYYFPTYTGKYVHPGAARRGIGRQIISVAYLDSGIVKNKYKHKGYLQTSVSASGRYLALDVIDPLKKHRRILTLDLHEGGSKTVFEDSTKGWIYGTSMAFAPNGSQLMFRSEKNGWNHIYTVDADGGNLTQQTEGNFEVPWARWLDDKTILYASTQTGPGERNLYKIDIDSRKNSRLTFKKGYRERFHLSNDNKHVVYSYSYFNTPFELYALNLDKPKKEVRLTHSIPGRFKAVDWQKEDYIRFTGRDGSTKLSMSVLKPLHLKTNKKYPVVVFAHGAGSLQNVYKGWSNHYYREYMFNQYLTARGYYVIEVDFRHSTGYGRKFREDVTGWMGKYETRDIEDGLRYLAGHYPQTDTSCVGIYGGSYGGFMALYAASTAPSRFDAAAALRAVTNWKNYYHTNPWYTLPRLGTPEADSAGYARSSPITYADSLKRPVLILHGLKDNNVGFQDAAQYVNKLIQSGNSNFEMMMYPAERHSFNDPDDWYDEYRRIFKFFEEKLQK